MEGQQAQPDCITVMEIIRPLLLSPHSDQLAQDIAAAIEAVCQMAKSDKMRQHALQEEVARQSAKAAAAEQARAQMEAKLRQLEASYEASASDKSRLQWYERELAVQTDRAEAALQERAALEDRIRLLESAQEQQLSRFDEERTALAHKWQQERSRLQRKVEHWNFEVLAQQREVNRLRQQLQQQGRLTAAGGEYTSGGGRMDLRLTSHSALHTSPPSGSIYSRHGAAAAADESHYHIPAYHPTASDGMSGPPAPTGQMQMQMPAQDASYEAISSRSRPQAPTVTCQPQQYAGGSAPHRHGVTPHYEPHSSPAAPGPMLQHNRHGVMLGGQHRSAAAEQAMTPRAGGFTPFSMQQPEKLPQLTPRAGQYTSMPPASADYAGSMAYNRPPSERQPAEPPRSPRPVVCADSAARSFPTNSPIYTAAAAVDDSFGAAQGPGAPQQQQQQGGVSAKHNSELQAFLHAAAAVSEPQDTQYGGWSSVPAGEANNAEGSSGLTPGMLHPPPIPVPQTPRPKVEMVNSSSSAHSTPYSVAQAQQEQEQAEQQGQYQNMGQGIGYSQQSSRYGGGPGRCSYSDSTRSGSLHHYSGAYRTGDSAESSPYPAAPPAQAAAGSSAPMQHNGGAPGALRQQQEGCPPTGYVHAGGYMPNKAQYAHY